ncbi:g2941 [Coccomyxa elongata]
MTFVQQALLSHAHDLHEKGHIPVKKWVVAGHSMGGRVASAVAHEEPEVTLGCIFFSYPMHPPNKTSQLRDNPLTALTSPILFVRGTNDAFCEHEQFKTVKARMTSSDVQVHTVESGDHSLKAKGGKQAAALAVTEAIEAAVNFAKKLADAASAADGNCKEPPQQAGESAPGKRKRRMDAEAALEKPTEPRVRITKKRLSKHDRDVG